MSRAGVWVGMREKEEEESFNHRERKEHKELQRAIDWGREFSLKLRVCGGTSAKLSFARQVRSQVQLGNETDMERVPGPL